MDEASLRREIGLAFEYSYRHDDWIAPLDEVLEGLTAEQALWRPAGVEKGIWEIVLHITVWNENIVARVTTGTVAKPRDGNWPTLPSPSGEPEWEQAKARLRSSLASVQALIADNPVDVLHSGPYGLADLLCRCTHNGYHLGQITKVREWMNSVS
jgi:hypothetical protein